MELDTLKKALLYECGHLLDKTKGNALNNTEVFGKVTSFFVQLRDKFSFDIELPYDKTRGFEEAEKDTKMKIDWLDDADILYFVSNGVFYFSNEEDATAFKLRWS